MAFFIRSFTIILLLGATHSLASAQAVTPASTLSPTNASAPPATVSPNPSIEMLKGAYGLIKANNPDAAMEKLNAAIKLDPKLFAAYVMRAGIYSGKKNWPEAEADFNTAAQLEPTNVVVKFNLGEIRFMQKMYDQARPRFAALMTDGDMGDFASYKVFLCDLYGGHADVAAKELAAFNDAGSHPSYYFGNAAWDLFNHKVEDARGWLVSASRIYPPGKNEFYASSLRELGYLPLPPPPTAQ